MHESTIKPHGVSFQHPNRRIRPCVVLDRRPQSWPMGQECVRHQAACLMGSMTDWQLGVDGAVDRSRYWYVDTVHVYGRLRQTHVLYSMYARHRPNPAGGWTHPNVDSRQGSPPPLPPLPHQPRLSVSLLLYSTILYCKKPEITIRACVIRRG